MVESDDTCIWMDSPGGEKGSSRNERKKRFSEEQVKSLESMFESQTKLEPRKKQQLAKELGLHPRQVAIWFQNKRARWKSKQLEREYDALKADYEALLSNFESLKNEKQLLTKELQKLAERMQKPVEERGKDNDSISNGEKKEEQQQQQPSRSLIAENSDRRFIMCLDDEENKCKFSEKEADLYRAEPPVGSSLISSAEEQLCLQPNWTSDQSCGSSQWWEFWPMN